MGEVETKQQTDAPAAPPLRRKLTLAGARDVLRTALFRWLAASAAVLFFAIGWRGEDFSADARDAGGRAAAAPGRVIVKPVKRPTTPAAAKSVSTFSGPADASKAAKPSSPPSSPAAFGSAALAKQFFERFFAKGVWPRATKGSPLIDGLAADDELPASPRSGPVGFVVARISDRKVISRRNADLGFIPASVAKAPTALYAMEALGLDYRFRTKLIATGKVSGGVLSGDLILLGGGDPTLDTADLARLVQKLSKAGVSMVAGRLIYDGGALPSRPEIEPGQPIYASYNPGVSGLGLNYNRVLFKWKRIKKDTYTLEMLAHSAGKRVPAIGFEAGLLDRKDRALFRRDRIKRGGRIIERWRVAPRSLGRRGQRWLPVQYPARYTADVFAHIASEAGIAMPPPQPGVAPAPALGPGAEDPRIIAEVQSAPLRVILKGMLKYSTNITAEAVGVVASRARGVKPGAAAKGLPVSGAAMSDWLNGNYGLAGEGGLGRPTSFLNHSGLTTASRLSPRSMVQILVNAAVDAEKFEKFKSLMPVRHGRGARKTAIVRAKTGTIYYGRGLAGYIECRKSGELFAFAYFNSDPKTRVAFDRALKVTSASPPSGAGVWLRRALVVERALMAKWTKDLCG
ncbi:MAG: D-alanyl-D-alanine carboxypeptidase/D-alanyl-D-alanine-endopeptidase [Neomegalonema sp.]|nr:D-alanyl-D-alanine carboxypeptidase/D-alanyl-D-alanine-endopeptidase [Neomegalonema sp.]